MATPVRQSQRDRAIAKRPGELHTFQVMPIPASCIKLY